MKKLRRIEPDKAENKKLKVAAYCRVSTKLESQESSIDLQVSNYKTVIQSNPQWEYAGVYFDYGSGLRQKGRSNLEDMINKACSGEIDYILTKSLSRLSRNVLDTLIIIRKLKERGINMYFENENLNSIEDEAEFAIPLSGILAQEESRNLSENIQWGYHRKFESGDIFTKYKNFMGYQCENGDLVIVPEQAEVVKTIFNLYLDGMTLQQIKEQLERQQIKTATGKDGWATYVIQKMLKNEKYIGDALLQKTYTVDFLSKKRVVNNGIVPQYYVENNHEPIIPREIFMQVQEEMARRTNLHSGKEGKKRVYSGKYTLSGIVYCGCCQEIYRRVHWNNRGCKSIVWRCVSRLEEKGSECSSPTINEETLQKAVVRAIIEVIGSRGEFMSILQENISTVLNEEYDKKTADIEKRLEELQQEILQHAILKSDYKTVADEIFRLREIKQNALAENAERQGKRQRSTEIEEFLGKQKYTMEEYDEQLVRKLIEKITVYENRMTIELKASIEIDVKILVKI